MAFLKHTWMIFRDFASTISLQYKLVLVNVITIFIPILAVLIYSSFTYINYINDQMVTSKLQALSQISSGIDSYIGELGNLSHSFDVNVTLRSVLTDAYSPQKALQNNELVSSYLMDTMSTHDEILGAYLFCENGQSYKLSRGYQFHTFGDFRGQPWYKAAKKDAGKNQVFSFNLLNQYVDYGQTTLTYAKGIPDPISGRYLGAVLFIVDIAKIRSLIAPYLSNQQSTILITDASGRIIYHQDERLINKLIVNQFYMNNILSNQNGFYQYDTQNGNSVGLFFTSSQLSRWRTVELLSLNLFFKPINQLRLSTSALMLLSMYFLVFVTMVFSYQITRPIRDLTRAVSSFGDNLEFSINIRSRDEIGRLSKSFKNMAERIKLLINNVYTAQIKQKEAELNALQSKINPHFLYNTLEMLANMADDDANVKIASASRSLGKILHYSLRFENEMATVREELQYVNHYLHIQQMRFNNRFEVVYDLTPAVLDFPILKLVIQPLLENSVYHGLEPRRGKGVLLISGERTPTGIILRIIDNGIGISNETLQTINESLLSGINGFSQEPGGNRGFALMNIHSRIQLKYGPKSGLMIESAKNKGTTVSLIIDADETQGF